MLKVLILGGTSESRLLADALVGDSRFEPLVSFAGRTASLQRPAAAHRIGGFGGAVGLAAFLQSERFDALVDATHPFAARMSANAVEAAAQTGLPLIRLERPAWQREPGDRWHSVATMDEAAAALGAIPRRVFLSIGRQEIAAFRAAPQHQYLVRAIDRFEPGLPAARVIAARGPFALAQERALLEREAIEIVVSKNSGTAATYPKIEAARGLSLPVIMVERPILPPAAAAAEPSEIVRWLEALHDGAIQRRGV